MKVLISSQGIEEDASTIFESLEAPGGGGGEAGRGDAYVF